jgi:hypothetical protein
MEDVLILRCTGSFLKSQSLGSSYKSRVGLKDQPGAQSASTPRVPVGCLGHSRQQSLHGVGGWGDKS